MGKRVASDNGAVKKLAALGRVVPGYLDLFGEYPMQEQLVEIVQKYPVFAWLSFLSRVQTTLAPPYQNDMERHAAAFSGVVGPKVQERAIAFAKTHLPHGNCLTFVEAQIAALQQLVVLYAPDVGDTDFIQPTDFDLLATALLMTWDLLYGRSETDDEEVLLSLILQGILLAFLEDSPILASRAYFMYGLDKPAPNEALAKLQKAFSTATSVELREYILGGLTLLLLEETQTPKNIADAWTPRAPPSPAKDPLVGDCVGAYLKLRSATVQRIREEIARRDSAKQVHNFTLIGLSRYPIVEFPDRGQFILSVYRLADSVFEGVHHAIRTAYGDGVRPLPDNAELGQCLGHIFETYISEILSDAFQDRFVQLPRSNTVERADGVVIYDDRIIICEMKNRFGGVPNRRVRLTLHERIEELKRMGIAKAAEQIANTIIELRKGRLDFVLGRQFDWTTTMVVPVIITANKVPLTWELRPYIESLFVPLVQLPLQDQIATARVLHVSEVELIPDIAEKNDVCRLLLQWSRCTATRQRSFADHLSEEAVPVSGKYMKRRYMHVMSNLADRHGLERSKLNFLKDEE